MEIFSWEILFMAIIAIPVAIIANKTRYRHDEYWEEQESKKILNDEVTIQSNTTQSNMEHNNTTPDTSNEEIEISEFYDTIVSTLAKEGFYPKTEKNSIYFEYKKEWYIVNIVNAHSLYIDCKIFEFKEDEVFFFQNYINQLNWNYLFSRFLIDDKERVIIARAWYPVNDSTNVSYSFWSVVRALISSANDFHNGLNSNK